MKIETIIENSLSVHHLEWLDESHFHGKTNTHYKLTLVSDDFHGMSKLTRHRKIHSLLKDFECHALSLHLYTLQEWEEKKAPPPSPKCRNRNH